jgi:hypothetical protein
MALDANDGDFGRGSGREMARDGGDPHGEGRFVRVLDCVWNIELCTCFPETCSVLCCGIDGYVEDRSSLNELFGGENSI